MKPRTKLQKLVYEMSQKLPAITDQQKQWGFDKCLDSFATVSRKRIFCLECGHKSENVLQGWQLQVTGHTCGQCKRELEMIQNVSPEYRDENHFTILTKTKDFQVIRIVYVKKFMKRQHPAHYFATEVVQYWISADGKQTTIARNTTGFGSYSGVWDITSELSIKNNFNVNCINICPGGKILPQIRRNGFRGGFHGLSVKTVFMALLSDPRAETLLKAKQISLFKTFASGHRKVDKYWGAIKMLMRNGHILNAQDCDIWLDYIDMLITGGKDIRNLKYIWPEDLHQAHGRLLAKARDIRRRRETEKKRAEIEQAEIEYARKKQRFFGLQFTEDDITIKVLESVREFEKEGDLLMHCVFLSDYHKKEQSLILSARVQGVAVETIEVNLKSLSIVQARGWDNKPSIHHTRIVELVTRNLEEIRKRQTTKKSA